MGSGGGKGTRAVASHDEDTTTLGVEAARLALRGPHRHIPPTRSGSPRLGPPTWTRRTPPRSQRPSACPPMSAPTTSAVRCARAPGALLAALRGGGTTLVVSSDQRDGLPDQRGRGGRRGRRGRPAGRRRTRSPGRVRRRGLRDRRVHRPLACPGRPGLQAVGGALRREPLPGARAATPSTGPSSRPGSPAGSVGPVRHHWHARPSRFGTDPQLGLGEGVRGG